MKYFPVKPSRFLLILSSNATVFTWLWLLPSYTLRFITQINLLHTALCHHLLHQNCSALDPALPSWVKVQGTTCHCLLQSPTPAEPASLKTICSVTRSPRPWSCMNCDGSCMNCDVICAQQHLFGNTKRDGPCYPCVNALLQTLKGTSSVLLQLNPMTRTGVINLSGCSMCTAENWIKY